MPVPLVSRFGYVGQALILVIICSPRITHCLRSNIPSNGEPLEWATAYAEISALRNYLKNGENFTRKSYEAKNKTIAVLLTGLQKNLLVETKLKHVVEPSRAQGWDVDVFMEIAGLGTESGVAWEQIANLTTEDFVEGKATDLLTLFEKGLNMIGARLVHGSVLKADYNVRGELHAAKNLGRLLRYSPFDFAH